MAVGLVCVPGVVEFVGGKAERWLGACKAQALALRPFEHIVEHVVGVAGRGRGEPLLVAGRVMCSQRRNKQGQGVAWRL